MTLDATKGNANDEIGSLEDMGVKEAKGTSGLIEPAPGCVLHITKEKEIGFDLGRAEVFWGTPEVSGETGDGIDVDLYGSLGVVANAHEGAHPFTQGSGDHDRSPFN